MTKNIEHIKHLKESPFSVPDHYFSDLKKDVLSQTHPKTDKLIHLPKNWMRYAAAAVFALLISGSWFLYYQNFTSEYDKLADGVASELYAYDIETLQYHAEIGIESELTNDEDQYLINSAYPDENLLYENN